MKLFIDVPLKRQFSRIVLKTSPEGE